MCLEVQVASQGWIADAGLCLPSFCANDPDTLLRAARLIEDRCDAVDLNLGCPQRIARRGKYGAFLMDDLDLVERIVRTLAEGLTVPVTCKAGFTPHSHTARTLCYQYLPRRSCTARQRTIARTFKRQPKH